MKRFLGVLLVLLLVISIIGCAPKADTKPSADTKPAADDGAADDGAADDGAADAEEPSTDPIIVGHLTTYTGPFANYGVFFDSSIEFALRYVNENPPLGRKVELINKDIGTIGESVVAKQFIEQDGIDILYNFSGDYMSYREWMLEYVAEHNAPLLPSIHAGSITAEKGGTAAEPIFRGQPMDDNQALMSSLHMLDEGVKSVVIFGVDREEMILQKETAGKACEILGIEVLDEVTIQHSMTYTAEAAAAVALNPDGIILFGQGETGGTLVKNLYEAGFTGKIIGETNSTNVEFFNTATQEAISAMEFVRASTYAPAGAEATDFYYAGWEDAANADLLKGIDNDFNSTYVLSAYDLVNATCLAIQLAGSVDADAWVDAMHKVTNPPGKKVYTYAQGMEALAAGEEIDYDGVTGTFEYTETGVVSGIYAIVNWEDDGSLTQKTIIDAARVAELGLKLVAAN